MSERRVPARAAGRGRRTLRVGFIPLTDCAPVIVAAALGFDRRHGIRIVPTREASWAAVRDKLVSGALDAAHMLYGMALAVHGGADPVCEPMAVLMGLNRNGQGITFSRALRARGIANGEALAEAVRLGGRFTFAHTFPTGTHALWLYYWLAIHGIDPGRDIRVITVPPPQMITRLRDGAIDGYSAGEPWHARAVADGIGFTAVTSQQIWPDHPEKVLAATQAFVHGDPDTARALTMAVLDACRFLDEAADLNAIAALLARPEYVGVPAEIVAPRLHGDYDDGAGRRWRDPHRLAFFDAGRATYPYLSDAMWFMTQHRRWGLSTGDPDYAAVAASVNQLALYHEAAAALGVPIPASPFRRSRLVDGRIWDGEAPADHARSFAIARIDTPAHA